MHPRAAETRSFGYRPLRVMEHAKVEDGFRMLLRLSSVQQDSEGWSATFYGKPDAVGNRVTVPVSETFVGALRPGDEYLFICEAVVV